MTAAEIFQFFQGQPLILFYISYRNDICTKQVSSQGKKLYDLLHDAVSKGHRINSEIRRK